MLIRNIAGLTMANDVNTMKCDEGGCMDAGDGGIIQDFRPMVGSGVFPPVQMYPYEPIVGQTPVTNEVPPAANVLPVTTGEPTPVEQSHTMELLILAGLGAYLYLNSGKKVSVMQMAVYGAGVGALYLQMKKSDKAAAVVTT